VTGRKKKICQPRATIPFQAGGQVGGGNTFCPYAGNIFALKTLDKNKKNGEYLQDLVRL
jgi:hypothetical protein